uniref:Glycerate kinase n=1 Tax=Angiostrongylus costaricensis TaxID=334426 RepID=A0A0R3PSK7_ANGCS
LHLTKQELTVSTSSTTVSLPLSSATRFVIVAFGKASVLMTLAAEKCLGPRLLEGIVIAPVTQIDKNWKLRSQIFYGAQNNLPDENSVAATSKALQCIQKSDAVDVVFLFLISGGGSALFCSPNGVSLEEKLTTIRTLTSNGADICVLNAFRQRLSVVKGGKTLNYIKKGQVLLMSDLIDDLIQFIASGPTVLQTNSMKEMSEQIVTSSKWTSLLPQDILNKFQISSPPCSVVTPHNIVIASNRDALAELKNYFTSHGYNATIVTNCLKGDATSIGRDFAELITTGRENLPDILEKFALLFGGETTVTIRGGGCGGRCQEMALSCFTSLSSCSTTLPPFLFLAVGTDGQDGPTDAAGAFFTNDDLNKDMSKKGEAFLKTSNSYGFWSMYNDGTNHIKPGPTGTNVMDIQIVLLQFR